MGCGLRIRRFQQPGFRIGARHRAGEAVFITLDGKLYSRQCARQSKLAPCLFEYVYFARPDSVIDGVSVYQARVNMGVKLAEKVKRELDLSQIDVVMPIPDTSRPSAMELAAYLGKPYREGFIKTATSDAPSSCPDRRRVKNPCGRS